MIPTPCATKNGIPKDVELRIGTQAATLSQDRSVTHVMKCPKQYEGQGRIKYHAVKPVSMERALTSLAMGAFSTVYWRAKLTL
jgi:hypothetical protein